MIPLPHALPARALAVLLLVCVAPGAALSQGSAPARVPTPAVVPPPSTLAPPVETRRDDVDALPAAPPPRELAKPDEDLRIDVTRYEVAPDAPAELRAALAELTGRYTGPGRSFEDLVNAAAEVTRFLQRDLGYYLGYAYLPEQEPTDGVIRIAVLEGRLDRVILQWSEGLPVDREVIEGYLARLRPGEILRVRDVERVVFLVNDLRGVITRFEVRAGREPGTAALVVTPRAESRWSAQFDLDANGSRFLGTWRLGALGQWNSPFGRGDGLTGNVLASTTGGLRFGLLGYTSPVGNDGFKLGGSLSLLDYELDPDEFPLGLTGQATTVNAFGLYPWVRSRNLNLFSLLSLDDKRYVDRQADVETDKTVRTIALAATGDFRDSLFGGAVSTFDAAAIAGTVDYPDGRPGGLDDAEQFTKLILGYTRLQDVVTGRMLLYVALRGQLALDNLDTTEQFRLGGPDAVRAFAPGEGTGDSGVVGTLELRVLPPEEWFGRIAREFVFGLFVDAGEVRYRTDPPPPSPGTAQRANEERFAGAGIALSWARPGWALRMSLAHPLEGTPTSDTKVQDPRLYFQLSATLP